MVSVAAIQLCPYSMKAALEYVNDGCSSGPIKLCLPKQTAGREFGPCAALNNH